MIPLYYSLRAASHSRAQKVLQENHVIQTHPYHSELGEHNS